jgi:M6 family metalloprotease-like protein
VGFIPDLAEAPRFTGGHVNWFEDYIAGIEAMVGRRKVLAILWDPNACGGGIVLPPAPPPDPDCKTKEDVPRGRVEASLFGQGGSPGGFVEFEPYNVASYFSAMSGGRFTIERGGPGIAGYYDAVFNPGMYFNHPGNCINGFDNGTELRIAEAVSLSNPDINYSQFDIDRDGRLTPQELAIIVVLPDKDGTGSSLATLSSAVCPSRVPMVLDGVEMPRYVANWHTSLDEDIEPFQFTTAAHELLHVLSLLDDNYINGVDWSTAVQKIGLMSDNRRNTTYLDPLHRLAFGWVTPVLVSEEGVVQVKATEQTNLVYILPRYNNPHGAEEYLVVENRRQNLGLPFFDDDIETSGIAVWHIVSDMQQITNAPLGTPEAFWDDLNVPDDKPGSVGQMARKGIRLIRPFDDIEGGKAVYDDAGDALWHNGWYDLDSATCFLVTPIGEPFQNQLPWADCTKSGYSLRFLTPAGVNMNVRIDFD